MPETFASSAAAVIVNALKRARAEGTNQIREEHLFASLLSIPDSRALLGQLDGPDGAQAVLADVREARRRARIGVSEQEALAEIGIDLDAVVARVEAQLGEGALDDTQISARRRRRRVSMSPDARTVLAAAQRQKAARGERDLAAEHLVLGLLSGPGLFADALRARGFTVAGVLQAMDGDGPHAAPGP
jgi:ATP-dependent Clp protease ATP-binding subunit ClpA